MNDNVVKSTNDEIQLIKINLLQVEIKCILPYRYL